MICTLHLTVCYYHLTYAFQSESTLYSCLNVKDILARSRHGIWSLSDFNWTRTHNHLVHKRALNHLAKLVNWLSCDWAVFFTCSEYGVPWHSDNYRVWIHSKTRTWHDNNIQARKFVKIHINFKLYQVFMSDFLCHSVLIFPVYIITKKNWNIFKHTFRNMCPKNIRQEKYLNYVKVTRHSERLQVSKWLDIHKRFQAANTLILYTWKA